MCIFEYITGPRTLGKGAHSRFQFQSQFAKVFSRLYSSHAGYHHSWRAKNAHLEAASEFFSSLACPGGARRSRGSRPWGMKWSMLESKYVEYMNN